MNEKEALTEEVNEEAKEEVEEVQEVKIEEEEREEEEQPSGSKGHCGPISLNPTSHHIHSNNITPKQARMT